VKWMVRPDVQAMWSMKSGISRSGMPCIRSRVPDFLAQNQALKAYVDQLDVAQAASPIDYHGMKISRHIAEAIEQAALGEKDPKTVLDAAAEKSNALLKNTPQGARSDAVTHYRQDEEARDLLSGLLFLSRH